MFASLIISLLVGIVLIAAQKSFIEETWKHLFNETKMFRGYWANDNQFPYQVAIQKSFPSGRIDMVCSGVIISKDYILTASSCVENEPANDLRIRAGSLYHATGGQKCEVSEIINNIFNVEKVALLKLKTSLRFGVSVQNIQLRRNSVPVGKDVVVSGWGDIDFVYSKPSKKLRYDYSEISSPEECRSFYPEFDASKSICVYPNKETESCIHDIGGPIVYRGQLVGIASNLYSSICGGQYPDIYTSVANI